MFPLLLFSLSFFSLPGNLDICKVIKGFKRENLRWLFGSQARSRTGLFEPIATRKYLIIYPTGSQYKAAEAGSLSSKALQGLKPYRRSTNRPNAAPDSSNLAGDPPVRIPKRLSSIDMAFPPELRSFKRPITLVRRPSRTCRIIQVGGTRCGRGRTKILKSSD